MAVSVVNGQHVLFAGKPFGHLEILRSQREGAFSSDMDFNLIVDIPTVAALLERHLFPDAAFELGVEVLALSPTATKVVRGTVNARHHAEYADGSSRWTYEVLAEDGTVTRDLQHDALILITGKPMYVDPNAPKPHDGQWVEEVPTGRKLHAVEDRPEPGTIVAGQPREL